MNAEAVILVIIIGFVAGTLSGLVGVGGGIITVPALVYFAGFSQQQAQGISLGLLLLPVGILAVFNYYKKGYIHFKAVATMGFAFVLGGWIGSGLAVTMPLQLIKKIFAVLLFFTAFKILNWDNVITRLIKRLLWFKR